MDFISEHGYISPGEYECLYAEAVRVVRERFGDVSEPYVYDGRRMCTVRSVPCTEHMMFELCWNEEIADQIMRERQSDQSR
ncbi:MAG TPA: hypothetical protein VFL57_17815 [Bryobacteraceae bacterium]|nr:hypothetical protein [Bryobacteraceae bacterium]